MTWTGPPHEGHGSGSVYGSPSGGGYPPAAGSAPDDPPEDGGTGDRRGTRGAPAPYGTPAPYGAPETYGTPETYGAPDGHGAPDAYGTPDAYGAPAPGRRPTAWNGADNGQGEPWWVPGPPGSPGPAGRPPVGPPPASPPSSGTGGRVYGSGRGAGPGPARTPTGPGEGRTATAPGQGSAPGGTPGSGGMRGGRAQGGRPGHGHGSGTGHGTSTGHGSGPGGGRVYGSRPDAGQGHGYHYDPDATMVLPVIAPDATMVIPVLDQGGGPGVPGDVTGSVARNSAVMAIGSLVSRATGFVRTAAIGAAISAGAFADDYNLSNNVPNQVYELLLGGALAGVIVPLLVRARKRDRDRGVAYAQRLLSLAAVFLAVATVLAIAMAPMLTWVIAGTHTPEVQRRLITTMNYLLLPEIFFYGMAALISAILNTRDHFAAPMWTPILNNIVVILTMGVFILLPGPKTLSPSTVTSAQVLVLGIGSTLGIVVQAAGLLPALRKVGFRWKWRWDWGKLRLGELARMAGWMLGYVVISQAAVTIVLKLAKMAGDLGGPGPAIFNNAYLIFVMAHGIVAVSISTALLPRMSAAASEHRYRDVAHLLSLGVRLSAVLLIPATACYLVLGRQLAVTLFQFGHYNSTQAVDTGWVIAGAGLGLVPFAIIQFQLFAFYALPDTRTPTFINIPSVAIRIGLDLIIYSVIAAAWVAAGFMVSNAISYAAACLLGYILLRFRLGPLGMGQVIDTLGRLTTAAIIAAIPALLVTVLIEHSLGLSKVASILQVIVGVSVLIMVYLAVARMLRVREVAEVWQMVRRRVGS